MEYLKKLSKDCQIKLAKNEYLWQQFELTLGLKQTQTKWEILRWIMYFANIKKIFQQFFATEKSCWLRALKIVWQILTYCQMEGEDLALVCTS